MKKMMVFVLACCMALLPLLCGSAQAMENEETIIMIPREAEMAAAAEAATATAAAPVASVVFSFLPIILLPPLLITLGIMVGNAIW